MKILTKEEEDAHYQYANSYSSNTSNANHPSATLTGGLMGGGIGTAAGLAALTLGSMRFPIVRHLTLPMKAFLVTSTGTFVGMAYKPS